MWIKFNDKKPPEGDCKTNLLLLWIKCPECIPYPEFYKGYEIGFFDGTVFIDSKYRYRIDNVEYWSFLQEPPTPGNVEDAAKGPPCHKCIHNNKGDASCSNWPLCTVIYDKFVERKVPLADELSAKTLDTLSMRI